MAKLKALLIYVIVLTIVASSLAEPNKKQNRKKIDPANAKKRVQADAPLPSKAKSMLFINILGHLSSKQVIFTKPSECE